MASNLKKALKIFWILTCLNEMSRLNQEGRLITSAPLYWLFFFLAPPYCPPPFASLPPLPLPSPLLAFLLCSSSTPIFSLVLVPSLSYPLPVSPPLPPPPSVLSSAISCPLPRSPSSFLLPSLLFPSFSFLPFFSCSLSRLPLLPPLPLPLPEAQSTSLTWAVWVVSGWWNRAGSMKFG